tara:strand:- start:2277 stop:2411 length:135 start_codon:yes stop_codon:yes gene_type:complete
MLGAIHKTPKAVNAKSFLIFEDGLMFLKEILICFNYSLKQINNN